MTLRPFHFAFPVRDIAEARAFYGDVLGCREGRSADDWVDFDFYGHQIVAHRVGDATDRDSGASAVDGHAVPVPHFGVVLKRVLLLIDSRHGIKPPDLEMMTMLDEAAVVYRLVLTKADKIKPSELDKVIAETLVEARKHSAAYPELLVTSSETRAGIAELRTAVLEDSGL